MKIANLILLSSALNAFAPIFGVSYDSDGTMLLFEVRQNFQSSLLLGQVTASCSNDKQEIDKAARALTIKKEQEDAEKYLKERPAAEAKAKKAMEEIAAAEAEIQKLKQEAESRNKTLATAIAEAVSLVKTEMEAKQEERDRKIREEMEEKMSELRAQVEKRSSERTASVRSWLASSSVGSASAASSQSAASSTNQDWDNTDQPT